MAKTVHVIGAPMDYGSDRRGVDMGPSAIRYADLAAELDAAGVDAVDTGDLLVPRAEAREPSDGRAKFLDEIEEVTARLADEVADTLADGAFPLVLGGDHAVAIGSLSGSARDAEIGALWLDAHGDFNTPATSPSGNVHGMPLAAALGRGEFADTEWANAAGLREENVALVGLRNLDPSERDAIRESEMTAFTMSDIDERGVTSVVDEALDIVTAGTDGVHVSLDVDWLDPDEAPGVGTPVRGGATYREAHAALEAIAQRDTEEECLRSLEVVEVNPILDESNRTADIAAELAASALGKRIL
ncbi:arginase [Halobacterium noricense]|uniref:arginase n=1 Tax=Halobacterium noricense TaxID=223182 RepID=UPI001E4CF872|nr:arginase [Halobacterium noricense]UHH26294.1 arginase [Halobacterium noricense]